MTAPVRSPGPWLRLLHGLCTAPHVKGKSRVEEVLLARTRLPSGPLRHPDGFVVELDPASPLERSMYLRDAEPETTRFLRSVCHPGTTLLDCGANIGFYTLLGATLVGPTGRVVAFEPTPDTYERLRRNVELNDLPAITTLAMALGEEQGTAEIFGFDPDNHGMNSLRQGGDGLPAGSCAVERLDDLVAAGTVPRPDVMKIDVEGAELSLIEGAAGVIADARPTIVIELSAATTQRWGYEPEAIVERLGQLADWRMLWLDGGRPELVAPGAPLPHEARFGRQHGSNYAFVPV